MILAPVPVVLVKPMVRWATVRVVNAQTGAIEREWVITPEEERQVREGRRASPVTVVNKRGEEVKVHGAHPPGLTPEEWADEDHRAVVIGRQLLPGQALRQGKGIVINCGVVDEKPGIHVNAVYLAEQEWAELGRAVHVRSDLAGSIRKQIEEAAPWP